MKRFLAWTLVITTTWTAGCLWLVAAALAVVGR